MKQQHQHVWFTSDTHFAHTNICKGSSKWGDLSQCRDFDTLNEMNNTLVEAINANVKEHHILYHLGDWSFGGFDNIAIFRKKINCKNIHLILGNHDDHIRRNHGGTRALFSSTWERLDTTINGQHMVLDHYAGRVWNKCHRGSWNLHGHSHGRLPEYEGLVKQEVMEVGEDTMPMKQLIMKQVFYKQKDMAVDTNNWTPYHFDQVKELMDKCTLNLEDMHDASHGF